ncbi:SMC-Scp complex subunit ScpB [Amaricoccus tamworthensis]|uniref:SMC-Scp complex subunit ScpB n=1 Tax=Amaricoccus tamworthensis TaxID=57002 RepID=UPI003C7D020E
MNETTHDFDDAEAWTLPSPEEQQRMVEAVLFASKTPLSTAQLKERLPEGCDIGEAVVALREHYRGRGVQLVRVGEGWAFRTAGDLAFLMSREVVETRKLSRAAVETLAIIAYHQPVTRAEIEEIRGVSVSSGTIDLLMDQGWVKLGRRRESPGRPMTLIVTPAFLDHFGLGSEKDLPGVAELRAAGLLDNRPGFVPTPENAAGEGDADLTGEDAEGEPADLFT